MELPSSCWWNRRCLQNTLQKLASNWDRRLGGRVKPCTASETTSMRRFPLCMLIVRSWSRTPLVWRFLPTPWSMLNWCKSYWRGLPNSTQVWGNQKGCQSSHAGNAARSTKGQGSHSTWRCWHASRRRARGNSCWAHQPTWERDKIFHYHRNSLQLNFHSCTEPSTCLPPTHLQCTRVE